MGCVSSKILTRSGSFQEELSQNFQRTSNGLEELLNSKNGGDQFLALLYTANTVAKKIKTGPLALEHGTKTDVPPEHLNSKTTQTEEPNRSTNPPFESADIETINTWELLADVEDKEEEGMEKNIDLRHCSNFKSTEKGCGNGELRARSFHTVEEYDALVERHYLLEHTKDTTKSSNSVTECIDSGHITNERGTSVMSPSPKEHIELVTENNESKASADSEEKNVMSSTALVSGKCSKREAMARELGALKVPYFEFSKSGSLKEWLKQGGQVFSPGSYVTPKFGNFAPSKPSSGEGTSEDAIFDPDLVAHLERDMKQLTLEEEYILEEILSSLEEGNREGIPRIGKTGDHIQIQDSL